MAFGEQDLEIFYRDGSVVTVTGSGECFKAHFVVPETIERFGSLNVKTPLLAGQPQIEFAMSAAVRVGLERGTEIEVRGAKYSVKDVQPKVDGLEGVAMLRAL